MVIELFGYRYSKYDKVGDYCRARKTSVEKYGIYPSINTESSKSLEPLFYVYYTSK